MECLYLGTKMQEVKKLKMHVVKGCLSNIPAKCGTNKNERLHAFLNSCGACVRRIGPELSEALLALHLHRWNERQRQIHVDKITKNNRAITPPEEEELNEIIQQVMGTYSLPPSDKSTETFGIKNTPIMIDSEAKCSLPSMGTIDSNATQLLALVLSTALILNDLKARKVLDLMKSYMLHYMTEVNVITLMKSLQSSHRNNDDDDDDDDDTLERNITALKLQKIPILGDGNCIFGALSYQIQNLLNYG